MTLWEELSQPVTAQGVTLFCVGLVIGIVMTMVIATVVVRVIIPSEIQP